MNREILKDEWVVQYRTGLCRSAGHFRKLALADHAWTAEDRQGLATMLIMFEEFLMETEFVSENGSG